MTLGEQKGSRRKRRQLLIEPPPPTPPPSSAPPTTALLTSTGDERFISDKRRVGHARECERVSDDGQLAATAKRSWLTSRAGQNHQQVTASRARERNSFANFYNPFGSSKKADSHDNKCQDPQTNSMGKFVISSAERNSPATMRRPQGPSRVEIADGQGSKSRRKSELASFLTILFGALIFVLLASQSHAGDSAVPLTRPRPSGAASSPSVTSLDGAEMNQTPSSRVNGTHKDGPLAALVSSTTSNPLVEEEEREDESSTSAELPLGDEGDGDSAAPSSSSSGSGGGSGQLRNLIVDMTDSGLDLLVNRLRPSETEAESGANETSGGLDGAERDIGGGQLEAGAGLGANKPEVGEKVAPDSWAAKLHEPNGEHTYGPLDSENKLAMKTYAKWRAIGDDIIELFSRKLMPVIMEHGYDVDPATISGVLQVFNGVRGLKPWALKLLDAWAKLAPGVLLGTQSDFGDFDECLNVRVDDPSGFAAANSDFPVELDPLTGLKSTTLVGRYCLADVEFPKPARRVPASAAPLSPPADESGSAWRNYSHTNEELFKKYLPIELRRPLLNFSETSAFKDTIFVETGNFFHMLYVDPLRVGICLTNKIEPESFAAVFNKLLEEFNVRINFRGRCVTKYERPEWTAYQVYSAYILALACSLVCLSTLLDLLQLKLNKLPWPRRCERARARLSRLAIRYRPLYTSFSLIRNTKRLFEPQRSHSAARSTSAVAARAPPLSASATRKQFNLNLAAGSAGGNLVQRQKGCPPSTATSTSSLGADSSVESSPAIERRSSATHSLDTNSSSTHELISHSGSDAPASGLLVTGQHAAGALDAGHISLLSLHGIRVITMTWMIVNHTYMFGGFFVLWAHRRLIDIAEWPKSLSFQMVLNGWLTVETYFFLSALIIVLNVMPLMRSARFNYFAYILHRLLRLLPAYIGLVCLNFLWPLISSGPVWLVKGKSFVQEPCENYLWTNFLFVNNWIWPEKQCMVHTWFLSADFQLYILAPMIVYLLYSLDLYRARFPAASCVLLSLIETIFSSDLTQPTISLTHGHNRRPALGHTLNLLIAILASILSGFVIYANKLLPTTLINKLEFDAIKQQLSYSYFATYQHMGPYCLGIVTGYLLHKRPHIRLPKHLTWILWIFLPPLSFTTLLLTYLWNGAYDDPAMINPSPLVSALYVAIHRIIWTALVAWLVFACSTGRAKLLSMVLSHSLFRPISRLSYSIYLVHLPVIMFRALNLRHTIEWTDQNILWEACGNFVASLFMGYFLNVAFESPIINLENYITGRSRPMSKVNYSNSALDTGKSSGYQDADSALETSSIPSTEPANSPEQERKSSSSVSTTSSNALTTTTNHSAITSLAKVNGHRKSLRPKQDSVDGIFGEQKSPSSDRLYELTTQRPNLNTDQNRSDSSENGTSRNERIARTPVGDDSIRKQRAEQARARNRFNMDQMYYANNEGDSYNITGEYRHYAPGGYQQWRMSNQLGSVKPTNRPLQYATLARTNRIQQQDHHQMVLNHQMIPSRHYQNPGYQRNYPMSDMPGLSQNRSIILDSVASSMMPRYAIKGDERAVPKHLERVSGEFDNNGTHQLGDQGDVMMARRHQTRYNTLTGTDTRDLRTRYVGSEFGVSQWAHRNWAQLKAEVEDVSSSQQGDSLAPGWLQRGALLPRIDSSTLRHQTRRRVDANADNSIVEGVDGSKQPRNLCTVKWYTINQHESIKRVSRLMRRTICMLMLMLVIGGD